MGREKGQVLSEQKEKMAVICQKKWRAPKDFAEAIGLARATVTNWMQGKAISDENQNKIADLLSIDIGKLRGPYTEFCASIGVEPEATYHTQAPVGIFSPRQHIDRQDVNIMTDLRGRYCAFFLAGGRSSFRKG